MPFVSQLNFKNQDNRLCNLQITTLYQENIYWGHDIRFLALNDSLKITRIRQKYIISLLYKTAVNFLTSIVRLVTYSSSFDNFHIRNSFSNPGNIYIKSFAQQDNIVINIGVNAKPGLILSRLAKKRPKSYN